MTTRETELDELICRDLALTLRAVDEKARKATFVAATENGCDGYKGKEYLRIDGMDLSRYAKNPVVLDSHDRYSIESIIGRADMKKEGRQLIADVTFAQTDKGEQAFSLVKSGMLNAGSVGFIPDRASIRELTDGEEDGEGEYAIKGPGRILKKSQLFEFSLCPVPADPDALRRSLHKEDRSMEVKKEVATPAPQAPANEPDDRSVYKVTRDIRALAGDNEHLQSIAERCILEGKDVDTARKEMLAEHTKRSAPVGTPEAPKEEKKEEKKDEKREVTDDVLCRTLTGSLNSY